MAEGAIGENDVNLKGEKILFFHGKKVFYYDCVHIIYSLNISACNEAGPSSIYLNIFSMYEFKCF